MDLSSLQPSVLSYLAVSTLRFVLGMIGVLSRKNGIVIFMCIEMMLNAVNLTLVTFSKLHDNATGSMMVFFVMCVAAAEAVVGLSIFIALFRNKLDIDINSVNIFKW
ncbi:MAG: NADH-quinone oxidoreductase subunit NuoK [Bacteroidota bacterium]